MKKLSSTLMLTLVSILALSQKEDEKTLLWKISGNGLERPSYLYGTIHMICEEDAALSDNMKKAIRESDEVYFEVDLDNIFEMLGAITQMKMKGDTTLRDLLNEPEYEKVKAYFQSRSPLLPFSIVETFKPMLAMSTLQGSSFGCERTAMLEQVIMEVAKEEDKKVRGLETMAHQAGVLDSIPYRLQARQLVDFIEHADGPNKNQHEMAELLKAYKDQDLSRLEQLMIAGDAGLAGFTEILLYNRNRNWVKKLNELMPGRSLMIAVGAGHLPGENGMLQLLRREGYTLTPVENKITKTRII